MLTTHKLDLIFPEKKGVNYDNLKLTPEGIYSVTRKCDSRKIIQKMISVMGQICNKHITDVTGNIGGDSIMFALNFRFVESIEIDYDTYNVLKNNVETYKLKNIRVRHGDSTKLFNWKTDVLYIDPPWGGKEYKDKGILDLYIGEQRLDLWIQTILEQEWRPNFIFIKLPNNYNFERLDNLSNVTKNEKFIIRKFILVGLVLS
jgi:16S rRNA G966 N2-methylase RsmD